MYGKVPMAIYNNYPENSIATAVELLKAHLNKQIEEVDY
ncbi:hypothetical protein LDG_6589 [Legionella drancourtii LLAP12]|uniref:Uncharacterized protein n=1 Tax=Legionella drancourtii LLAP12 TaxID=658187 RepID=G9EMW9_9GAMM|nr:hypothetical protein LDG_6589 [Legionella drancourtii LLAP12]